MSEGTRFEQRDLAGLRARFSPIAAYGLRYPANAIHEEIEEAIDELGGVDFVRPEEACAAGAGEALGGDPVGVVREFASQDLRPRGMVILRNKRMCAIAAHLDRHATRDGDRRDRRYPIPYRPIASS